MSAAGGPPTLPGLTYLEPIGTGGFADVYLYEQALPSRRVAVKVLRESSDDAALQQFRDEANVMAQLSGHPSIVPIYQADVSDGRAYLVMEYCPPPHLAQRYRTERLAVPEVLELTVRIASAVETAHRVGILHRDIKPHNILTSAYGAPLLTDFGIAAAVGEGDDGANYGMSVPWSPPEAFEDPAPLDVRSDVFSLAATVYSLLAGRSPFEVPGAANDSATLIHRIERQEPSRVLRADVPDSLNDLLLRCLSKQMADRPPSAMAFARAVQEIQIELHLPPTRLEVLDATMDTEVAPQAAVDERTRVRPVSIIVPDEVAERGTRLRPRQVSLTDDKTQVRPRAVDPAPHTVPRRAPAPAQPDGVQTDAGATEVTEDPKRSRGRLIAGGVLAAVVAGAVVAAMVWGGEAPAPPSAPRDQPPDASTVISGGPSVPTDLSAKRTGGTLVVSWTNPSPEPDDEYRVRTGPNLQDLDEGRSVAQTQVEVRVDRGEMVCFEVRTIRGSSLSDELTECVTR